MGTNKPSGHDKAVLDLIENAFDEWAQDSNIGEAKGSSAEAIRDALVSHGWGPKPAVSAAKIGDIINDAYGFLVGSSSRGIRDYLRECGVEVSDGDCNQSTINTDG